MDNNLINQAPKTAWHRRLGYALLLVLAVSLQACSRRNWAETTRDSANLAPTPAEYTDAVVMAFRAKTWGLRGIVADHTWVATKAANADTYKVYEVIGWRKNAKQKVVRISEDVPDRHWFGSKPRVMADVRGPAARDLVNQVAAAAESYPYAYTYRAFPGPNSNTFISWIAQEAPELNLHLPLRAIGRSYR